MNLRLGEIPYANVWPIYTVLREEFNLADWEIVRGVPTELNRALAEGRIDVSPSSSVEYLLNPGRYRFLPDLSISSTGPVRSILLLSNRKIEDLDGRRVALTTQSATSTLLTRVILEEFYGMRPDYHPTDGPPRAVLGASDAYLLIGDNALLAGLRPSSRYTYDLGELWWRKTGLPFVYALWIAETDTWKDPRKGPRIAGLAMMLQEARTRAARRYAELARKAEQTSWYPAGRLEEYWNLMSYELDTAHNRGMELFAERVKALEKLSNRFPD